MGTIKLKKPGKAPAKPQLKYDKYNIPYYEVLPPNFRVATIEDFWDKFEDNYKMGIAFLIHSEINPGQYYAQSTRKDFTESNDFWQFLRKGRVYVLDK